MHLVDKYRIFNFIKFGLNFFIFITFFFIFLTYSYPVYSQKGFIISAGVAYDWDFESRKLENLGEDNAVFIGGIGYQGSIGYSWLDDPELNITTRLTYERLNSEFQSWDRVGIGTGNANIFRLDPFFARYRIRKSNFWYDFNLFGLSLFTGIAQVYPNSYCYFEEYWYPIDRIDVKSTIGWSLCGFGLEYHFTPHFILGFETNMLQEDNIKVDFHTPYGIISSDVGTRYFLFPLKFNLSLKI